MSDVYAVGTEVSYVDDNATVSDGTLNVTTGFVNGEVIEHEGLTWVPVWTERDNGRESTTVWVPAPNIMGAS